MDNKTSTYLFSLCIFLFCIASKYTVTGQTGSCLTPDGTKICCFGCTGYLSTCLCSPNCHKHMQCCPDYQTVCHPVSTTSTTTTTSATTVEVPDPVTNPSIINVTQNSISLQWTLVSNVNLYQVLGGGLPPEGVITNTTSITIHELQSGVCYTFSIAGVARDGITVGPATEISTFTLPDPVTNTSIINVTQNSISLQWTLVSNVNLYQVLGGGLPPEGVITNTTSITIHELQSGVCYTFSIAGVARDGITVGPATEISTFTRPGSITNLFVTSVTATSISLGWNAVLNAMSYLVFGDGLPKGGQMGYITSMTINGLIPGTNNSFIVAALAGDGVTVGSASEISAFTIPGNVTGLQATVVNKTYISVNWSAPFGDKSSYFVMMVGAPSTNITTTTERTVFSDVIPGTNYTISVYVMGKDNVSESGPVSKTIYVPIPSDWCASRPVNQCCHKPDNTCKSLSKTCSCDVSCPKSNSCCEDYFQLCHEKNY
ncbi:receptor-type tyrosine-protein phosphatase eta-like isoform X1 [Protopterus annectens]|uniref:receptor-type tyrosine-protein phosphatase eta-like isoform X1 n=1 Tax=Protopterus annectens TaxID=7888 RepID=UPI001CFB7DC6|nr:receptor-type tyrosine-protein phosphatase eta-like isoform X1 [Protopterus annectens]